jgi:hypothetical protein
MRFIKKIILIGFVFIVFIVFIGCIANKKMSNNLTMTTVTMEKLSIGEKLKENNHLPIAECIALYYQLKKEQPNAYNFVMESELNDYAYELLNANLQEEAIDIFKLNVSQFPNSAETYYNLADAYSNLSYKYRE